MRWTPIHPLCQTSRFPEGIPGILRTIFPIPKDLVLYSSCLDPKPRNTVAHTYTCTVQQAEISTKDELNFHRDWAAGNAAVILAVLNHEWWIPLVNSIGATKCALYAQETREEQSSKESEKQKSCLEMVSHLTWVCTLQMRGAFSPEFHLPLCSSHYYQIKAYRLSGLLFHCKGKLRVCTLLCLANTESAGREERGFQGFHLMWVLGYTQTLHLQYMWLVNISFSNYGYNILHYMVSGVFASWWYLTPFSFLGDKA